MKLSRAFFNRPTLQVANDLLGTYLVFGKDRRTLAARIVETEAYISENDPACHAAPGRTARNRHLYGRPATIYVYLIYGMYYCLNVVTEREGFPAAVLIRAAEPVEGFADAKKGETSRLLNGPGKLCRAFGIDLTQNGADATGTKLFFERRDGSSVAAAVSPRIGISKATELPWRFYDSQSSSVSGPRRFNEAARLR